MSKSFDKKDVFSWANCEEAKRYIGMNGYFAHTLSQLTDRIQKSDFNHLEKICDFNTNCFCRSGDGVMCYWSMFLPADKVKEVEEEKKYRAYKNFDEFDHAVGDIVHLRLKHKHSSEYIYLITGFNYNQNSISINGVMGNFENFFDMYEIFNGKGWQPFGVKE